MPMSMPLNDIKSAPLKEFNRNGQWHSANKIHVDEDNDILELYGSQDPNNQIAHEGYQNITNTKPFIRPFKNLVSKHQGRSRHNYWEMFCTSGNGTTCRTA